MNASPVDTSVVCPILIGRERYIDAINRVLDASAAGHGHALTICGEAGIGKSRLMSEVRRLGAAHSPQFQVAQGHCFEQDASLPYAPIVDLLRACMAARSPEDFAECIGPDGPHLLRLLPDLASVMSDVQPAPPSDPEQEKRQLLGALVRMFGRVATRQPLLIIIEDLHWSDDASLEFLGTFAHRLSSLPAVLAVTFRSDEVQPALRRLLTVLDRERLTLECPLPRLSPDEVARMIRGIFRLQVPVHDETIDTIYPLTEGNPFFIEEVLKSLVSSGGIFFEDGGWERKPIDELHIPRSIHDSVADRRERLTPAAQRVLDIAAVTGRRFDFALLQHIAALDEPRLLDIIKELISAQLVVEESADHFAFRHALTRQSIYSGLLARERRMLHHTIGETIQQVYATSLDAHLAELAYHFYEAEAWDEAYYYARRVGQNAQRLHSPAATIEHLSHALEAARHLRVRVPAAIYRARGQAHETLGGFDAARADYERALDAAQTAHDGAAEWQAQIDLGFLWSGRDYERAGALFRHASDLAESIGDSLLRAQSLDRVGNWLVNTGRAKEGIALHRRALAIIEEHGDPARIAETLDLLGMACGIYGDYSGACAHYTRAIDILRPLGPSDILCSALASRCTFSSNSLLETAYLPRGVRERPRHDGADAAAMGKQLENQAALSYALWASASVADGLGQFGDALTLAGEGLRVARSIDHEQWVDGASCTLGRIYNLMLQHESAISVLGPALESAYNIGSAWWIGMVSSELARSHLLHGSLDAAQDIHARADAALRGLDLMPRSRLALIEGRLALERGDAHAAAAAADRMLASIPGPSGQQHIPSVEHLRGDALIALREPAAAIEALMHAKAAAIEREAAPYLWPIHRSLARACQMLRRADDAERESASARAIVEQLASTIDDAGLRESFVTRATATLLRPRPVTPNRAAKEAFGGLTAREREVAAFIATGKTNREIADDLVLGERTIETHVGNILSKLGFSSRAQIAAWAVEKKLSASSAR